MEEKVHRPGARTQCHSSGNLSEMGHYELKAASSRFFSPSPPFAARHGGRDEARFSRVEARPRLAFRESETGSGLTSSVNRGRQNTRVGPCAVSPPSSRNFGAPWKKVAQEDGVPEWHGARARYVPCDTRRPDPTETRSEAHLTVVVSRFS